MCGASTRQRHEEIGASRAPNKTIAMVEEVLGQSVPGSGTPSDRRDRLMVMLRQHLR